jgi:dGTPase
MREHGERFDHNLHALYIVEQFEQRYLEYSGLNLTFEVREGIIKHSRDYPAAEFPHLAEYLPDQRPPLESQLIDLVDEIAYNTADLDDGFEAHLVDLNQLRAEVPIFEEALADLDRRYPRGKARLKFNEGLKHVLDLLATDLIETMSHRVEKSGAENVEDVRRQPHRLASFSPPIAKLNADLKRFLFAHLYSHPSIDEDRDRSVAALDALFSFFLDHPERMPQQYAGLAKREPTYRVVCDYIAGMTDHFLLRQCQELL